MRPFAVLLSTTALIAARPAFAQNTAPARPLQQTAPTPDTTPHRRPRTRQRRRSDIVVTAQGRAQALADVPVAISAVTAETLQNSGANDIRQLNQLAPSLLVSSTGSEANGSARIRGIGTVGDNPGLESSVAVFIDGVYRSRSGIGLNELGEIDRIEVLRGPQGTLGGRNSSAGLISIISKAPVVQPLQRGRRGDLRQLRFHARRRQRQRAAQRDDRGAGRRRLCQARRLLPRSREQHRVNDRDRYFVRGQLLFEPTDATSASA